MGWNVVQSASSAATGTATTKAATYGSNVSAGNKLICYIGVSFNTTLSVSSVKDAAGNSMTQVGFLADGTNTVAIAVYAMDVPAGDVGTAPTITVTLSRSSDCSVDIQEVSGLAPGNTLAAMIDGTCATSSSAGGSSIAQPSYTSTAPNEFLVSVEADNGGPQTATQPSGYTLDAHAVNSNSFANICPSYKNSAGGAESGTWTFSGTTTGTALAVVAFKLAAAAPVIPAVVTAPPPAAKPAGTGSASRIIGGPPAGGPVTHQGTATLTGSGSLSGSGVFAGAAAVDGEGTLSGTGAFAGSAALSGSGSLSAAVTLGYTAALSGSGSLSAAGVLAGSSALSGSGTLSAGNIVLGYSTALSGTGVLAVSGVTLGYSTALSGSGSLTAAGVFAGSAAFTGSGTITATGTVSGVFLGTAVLSGSGSLAAAGVFAGSAALSGSGSLAASGTFAGTVTMSGSGVLAGAGAFGGTVTMSGSGTLGASWTAVLPGRGQLSGQGSVGAAGVRQAAGAAILDGTGTLSAVSTLITPVQILIPWSAGPARPRWSARAASRWAAGPSPARWRITMQKFEPVAAISLEYINIEWASELAGTLIDPTGQTPGQPELPVQFAVPVSSGNPLAPAEPVTWYSATWLLGTITTGFIAQGLVGPGGGAVTLTAGQDYDVWSKISGSPESPARFAGTQAVY